MGYARRKLRHMGGNGQSSVLKPVRKGFHCGLWIGGSLFVICVCCFCIRNAKKDKSAMTYGFEKTRTKSTWMPQTSSEESWGRSGSIPHETVQMFRNQGFSEAAARAMAEEFEKDLDRRIRNRSW